MVKSLLKSKQLADYVADFSQKNLTSTQLALIEHTQKLDSAIMQISADQALFLSFLTQILSPEKVIEIGTYTGLSALSMAQCLPAKGELYALDINEQWTKIARDYWDKAGVGAKVKLHLAPALGTLAKLRADHEEKFGLAFIDADKKNNYNYYDLVLPLLKPQGVIVIDNGLPADPQDGSFDDRKNTSALIEQINQDQRTTTSLLTVGAGFIICIKNSR